MSANDDRTMVIERVIAAPVAAVWTAWTDPEACQNGGDRTAFPAERYA